MSVICFIKEIQKRKLVCISLNMCLGIIVAERIGFRWGVSTTIIVSLTSIFIMALIMICKAQNTFKLIAWVCLVPLVVGLSLYSYQKGTVYDKFSDLDGIRLEIQGRVDKAPQKKPGKIGLVIKTDKILAYTDKSNFRKIENGKMLIWVSIGENKESNFTPGQNIQVNGELSLPQGVRNPMGFDYRKYLASKKISAVLYAKESDVKYVDIDNGVAGFRLDSFSYRLQTLGYGLRNSIIDNIKILLPEKQAALLSGMLIGYTDDLDEATEQQFRDAGLSHIMAVSGSNVAFIVFPLFFLLRKLGLKEKTTAGLIIPILVLFIFVTGFSASVARAVIMAIIVLIGKFIYRETDTMTTIAVSVLVLLISNTFMLFDIGFQLSYGATLGIIFFYKSLSMWFARIHIPNVIVEVLAATVAAQIGVLPVSAYYFNRVSIISLVANLLVVPMTELITIIGFIMVFASQIFLFGAKIISVSNLLLLSAILKITQVSASLPFAAINVPTPRIWEVVLFYVVSVYYFYLKPLKKFHLGLNKEMLAWTVIAGVFIIRFLIPGNFQIYFLDVGQGDSCLVKTENGKSILIDGGDYTSKITRTKTMGDSVILPFLMDKGIMKLDVVIVSHGHDDHFRGLVTVLENMKVDKLLISDNDEKEIEFKEVLGIARKKGVKIYSFSRGENINIDKDTKINFLYPTNEYKPINSTLNNGSLVLKLVHKGQRVLLCGDIEEEVEKYLVESQTDIGCDVLKLSHHGSATSSSADFLKETNAKVAITSVGRNNFGHPSSAVLSRVSGLGIKNFRTDECGALEVSFNNKGIKVKRTVMD